MRSDPTVSVIVPTYNRSGLIGRAIRSILAQSIFEIEIIVVDDASTDGTEDVVKSFCDERIRYIKLQDNGGASRARNIGAAAAQGKYLAFLDSDDEWLMEMLEMQLAVLTSDNSCDAVLAGFIRYYGQSPEYISPPALSDSTQEVIAQVLSKNFVTPQILMLTRSCFAALGGFDERLSHREDWDFGLRLVSRYKVKRVCAPLAMVYETPGNLTSMTSQKLDTLELFLEKHQGIFAEYKQQLAHHLWFLGHSSMLIGRPERGHTYLSKAVHTSLTFKTVASAFVSFFGKQAYTMTFGCVTSVKRQASAVFGKRKNFSG